MARKIGQMLNSREPKIVNGPQILDKYVGESEANIRRLFAEAEEEEKRMGPLSGLHIIIFDEIDAICKVCMIFFIKYFCHTPLMILGGTLSLKEISEKCCHALD